MPGANRQVLQGLAALWIWRAEYAIGMAYVDHDIPELKRAVPGGGHQLILVDLGPRDVVEAVLRFVAASLRPRACIDTRTHSQFVY